MRQQRFWMRGGGSGLAALAALVTTLCCLGFPALVGLLSALGAGFLLNDRYLEPGLFGNAPAHGADHRAPYAPASSAWTVHPLPYCCRSCLLRHLRHDHASICVEQRLHG